jgi:hypothetical protein
MPLTRSLRLATSSPQAGKGKERRIAACRIGAGQAFVSQTGIFARTMRQPAGSMINGAPETFEIAA